MKPLLNITIVSIILILFVSSCTKEPVIEPIDLIYHGNIYYFGFHEDDIHEIRNKLRGKEIIDGNIHISTALEGINVLKNIKEVTGNITLRKMGNIEDLSFFSKLEKIGGSLELSNNPYLQSLYGLDKISELKSLRLYNNHPSLDMDYIKDINVINDLKIVGINEISIPKFKNIVHLKGYLHLWDNTNSNEMKFLPNLEKVDSNVYFASNNYTNLEGLDHLNYVGGDFNISHNSNLENLNGLNNLQNVLGSFSILHNPKLNNIEGLNKLESANQQLTINDTDCTNLKGLENLINTNWITLGRNSKLYDFCPLKTLLTKNDSVMFNIWDNFDNPTIEDIKINCL